MPVAPFLRYWKLALGAVLLLALGVQTMRVKSCNRARAKVEAQLADANATIRQFDAAGERIETQRKRSVSQGNAERAKIRTRIERIVVPAPVAGCDTPPDVMEAFK